MTSCAYIYLYVQYKTRLITECTVHCPMAWDCFLTMDNSLCLVLPRQHLLLLGQVCEVVSHSICYCWPSKPDVNRDLTTGVLKIRTKKETIKGRGDCKGTLDRLLAPLFFRYFQSNCTGSVWRCDSWGLASAARPITKQDPEIRARQQSSATPLLRIQGEYWQWYHTHPIQLKSIESHSSLPSFRHSNCKIERQGQFFVP